MPVEHHQELEEELVYITEVPRREAFHNYRTFSRDQYLQVSDAERPSIVAFKGLLAELFTLQVWNEELGLPIVEQWSDAHQYDADLACALSVEGLLAVAEETATDIDFIQRVSQALLTYYDREEE